MYMVFDAADGVKINFGSFDYFVFYELMEFCFDCRFDQWQIAFSMPSDVKINLGIDGIGHRFNMAKAKLSRTLKRP